MKKLKLIVTSLCLGVAVALVIPTVALADGTGPQGGVKSTTPAPPPPPPPPPTTTWAEIIAALGLGVF